MLATNVFNATIPTAALFSKAVAQTVDYFLADENKQARGDIVDIFLSKQNDASAIIMGYVREALRLNPIVRVFFVVIWIETNGLCTVRWRVPHCSSNDQPA